MVTNRAGVGADLGTEALGTEALAPEVQPARNVAATTTISTTHTQRVLEPTCMTIDSC